MYFLILGRDGPGMLAKRLETRPAHLDYLRGGEHRVKIVAGSPMAEDDGETMNGSFILVEAPDKAAAEEFAKGDPYAKAGVFASQEIWTVHSAFEAQRFLKLAD